MGDKIPDNQVDKNGVLVDDCSGNSELFDLWQPDQHQQTKLPQSLDEQICQRTDISPEQLDRARSEHSKTPQKRIGQILLEMGAVKEEDLVACLAEQYDLPFVRLERETIDQEVVALLDRSFIESHNIMPLRIEDGKIVVGVTDPTNIFLLDEVRRKTGKQLILNVCSSSDIQNALENISQQAEKYQVDELIEGIETDDVKIIDTEEEDIADLEQAAGDSPVIKFVNYIIVNAVRERASDIHIEPGDKKLIIRYRIDGVLFRVIKPPYNMHAAIVSRIKIMSNLDIAERRLPQDGRCRVVIKGRNIDMRVSTLPSSHGEKVVIRILDTGHNKMTLDNLGLEPDMLDILKHQLVQPHGIILVTGPTGSGKSTTLYSALGIMDVEKLNLSTVEDPVEYRLNGVTQVQVHESIGMTFSAALRSLLRQDPDVIMVGEIRDEETARIAIQASLTGHLVLSTLHTNDAPSSITRLINIGVEPYLIAASTNAVLAQRLVRRICQHCKKPLEATEEQSNFLKLYGFDSNNIYKGDGCEACRHTGYQGRIGLYELLVIDDTYRDIITGNPTVTELRRMCKERGMVSLRDAGFRKVQAGLTTIEEVMRVTESTI